MAHGPVRTRTEANGKRVLVCDDERHIVHLIRVNLERQGYEVRCAYGGAEAIGLLQRERFDLAVIDRYMPVVDGQEVLEWIKSHDETRHMRVVMLKAKEDGDDSDDPNGPLGADLYLTKPFNPLDLPK